MVTTTEISVQIKFVLENGDDPICFPSQIDQTEAVNGKLGQIKGEFHYVNEREV